MVGEDEHADLWVPVADLLGGDEALVGVAGGHPDVGEDHVGQPRVDEAQQRGCVAGFSDHLESGVGEQPCEPFAQQSFVFGEHHAHVRIVSLPGRTLVRCGRGGETIAACPGAC